MSLNHPPSDAIELSMFWTWIEQDGICRTKTKPKAEIEFEQAKENSIVVTGFYTNKKFPLLIDARNVKQISGEARKHFSTNGRETVINAMAIIVKSPLSRVVGNFFMGLNKPPMPARLFEREDEAVKWLKQYL